MSLLPNLDQMTDNEKLAVLESIQKSIAQSKEIQKKKIGENVDLVVQALKKIEYDITTRFESVGNSIEKRVLSIKDGRDGVNGKDGRDGKDGKSGKDGLKGDRGADGQAGRDGIDGVDGVSVVNANIDFDGSLIISLSDGREINVGEVVSADVAEKIKVISTMSTNAAVGIKDEGTSISTGVKNINFVGATVTATNSGDDVTVNVSAGTGTVTSVGLSGGTTGLTTTGSPITTTGTITLGGTLAVANGGTGTASPTLVAGTNITSITGTWPNQTINASGGSGTVTSVAATAGTGISVSGSPITTSGTLTITNTAPDQTVALTQGGTTTITGTYPNFTISSADQFQGTVTSVTGTSPVASSGGATPAISLSAGYGDTLNPYASKTANFVLAAPNGSAGVPTFRAVVAADIPTLNQNTTGTASNVTGTVAIANGGTGSTTAANALTALGAVAKAGDTMTGALGFIAGSASTPSLFASGDTNTGIFFPAADTIAFSEGGVESMRIDSAGNVGIGVTPSAWNTGFKSLEIKSSAGFLCDGDTAFVTNNCYFNSSNSWIYKATDFATRYQQQQGTNKWFVAPSGTAGNAITFTEVMRIDSSGNVGIGTSSPAAKLHIGVASNVVDGTKGVRITNPAGTVVILECGSSGDSFVGTTSNSDFNIRTNNTLRATFDTNGDVCIGKTSGGSLATNGIALRASNDVIITTDGAPSLYINRNTNDGTLVQFRQANTEEGSISVSGTTVSYNGGHLSRWAQTTTAKDESLVKGTVLSNLDEMNVYTDADGNPVDNEQLNKVKVSDVEGDANVAGVFVNWSHDDAHDVDEINMAMTGDMIIRIAQGTIVQRGDLLMSAGDGTAKPQGDDIVRSKTIAKVTSTHVTCTYADGSFCVPCVLMAC